MKKVKLWEIVTIAAILTFLAFLFWPIRFGGKEGAIRTACLSNVKQLALAQLVYAGDYDNHFPDRDGWMDSTFAYLKREEPVRCTAFYKEHNPQIYGYGFNSNLSRAKLPLEGAETVPLVFDSLNLARNASGTLESLPKPGRHPAQPGPKNNIAYADGHAKGVGAP